MRKVLIALAGAMLVTGCYAPGAVVPAQPGPVVLAPPPQPAYQCLQPLPGEALPPYVDPYTGRVMQGMHTRGACTQVAPMPYAYGPPVVAPGVGLRFNFNFGKGPRYHHHHY